MVFILSRDGEVHVHSTAGQQIGAISVGWGTAAISLVPRSRRMLLLQEDGSCSSIELMF